MNKNNNKVQKCLSYDAVTYERDCNILTVEGLIVFIILDCMEKSRCKELKCCNLHP